MLVCEIATLNNKDILQNQDSLRMPILISVRVNVMLKKRRTLILAAVIWLNLEKLLLFN